MPEHQNSWMVLKWQGRHIQTEKEVTDEKSKDVVMERPQLTRSACNLEHGTT